MARQDIITIYTDDMAYFDRTGKAGSYTVKIPRCDIRGTDKLESWCIEHVKPAKRYRFSPRADSLGWGSTSGITGWDDTGYQQGNSIFAGAKYHDGAFGQNLFFSYQVLHNIPNDKISQYLKVQIFFRYAQHMYPEDLDAYIDFDVTEPCVALMDPEDPNDWYMIELVPNWEMLQTAARNEEDFEGPQTLVIQHPFGSLPKKQLILENDIAGYGFAEFRGRWDPGLWSEGNLADNLGNDYRHKTSDTQYPEDIKRKHKVIMLYYVRIGVNNKATDEAEDDWNYVVAPYKSTDVSAITDCWKESADDFLFQDGDFSGDQWFYAIKQFLDHQETYSDDGDGIFEDNQLWDPVYTNRKEEQFLYMCGVSNGRVNYRIIQKYVKGYRFIDLFKKKNWDMRYINVGTKIWDLLLSDEAQTDPTAADVKTVTTSFAFPKTRYMFFKHVFKETLITKIVIPYPVFKGWQSIMPGSFDWEYAADKETIDGQQFSILTDLIEDVLVSILVGATIILFVKFGLKSIIKIIIKIFGMIMKKRGVKMRQEELVDLLQAIYSVVHDIRHAMNFQIRPKVLGEYLKESMDISRSGAARKYLTDYIDTHFR